MGFLARLPIRLRVTLAFAIAMAIVLAATGVFLYVRLGSALDRTIDQSLRARSTDVGALVRQGDSLGKEGEGMTQVLDPRGAVLAATPGLGRPLLTTEEISRASREAVTIERSVPNSDEAARILATPLDTQRGQRIVVVGASLEQRGDALENLFVALLIGGPLALLLASLAGYGLAAAALRPVESMRREAEAVSAAEPGRRLPLPPAQDEISRLGETLNVMLGRLESALARERRFVSDASHELRTPLSALRTELELALRRERTPEELEAALRSAAEETDRLSQLAEDLLVLARADGGKLPVRLERVSVREVLDGVRERYARRVADVQRPLELRVEDGLSVSVDRLRVEQALGNLVENALRHGGGTILLEARSVDGRVELHVQDEGAGFAPDFIADAFEPFSRGDPARASQGAGLGLAIVDVIARAHGGTAHVANVDGGADVWLELPR
ncbi:MAG TPA: ATP-binding protein [Gaiellaceae bacterium]|jgi:two-component system OmpR family sensor kinase|nr:ATP-binding protein [Gaiellaceae bacterium]